MRIALDQSIRTTGWSVYNEDKMVDYGHWTIPSDKTIGERLILFILNLKNLCDQYGDITDIAFEDISLQRGNVETYRKLAYVQAAIFLFCEYYDYNVDVLSPSKWRAILHERRQIDLGKKRQEQKEKAQAFVSQLYNIQPTEDEADSLCIGLAAYYYNRDKQSAF